MKKKIINILICIIVLLVVFASFKVPELLFKIQEKYMQMHAYEREESKGNMNIETEKIYLVKAIHDIEKESSSAVIGYHDTSKNNVIVSSAKEESKLLEEVEKELIKLQEHQILKRFDKREKDQWKVSFTPRFYKTDNANYTVNYVSLQIGNDRYMIEIEEKTGKIIHIVSETDNLFEEMSSRDILEHYIQYLDLYIIEDWIVEESYARSETANLEITLDKSEGEYMLAIHSATGVFKRFEVVKVK